VSSAEDYIKARLASGALTTEHIEELVRGWQESHGLEVDGRPGPLTITTIENELRARVGPPPIPSPRCWPLRILPDLRRPVVTSRHFTRNPDRKNHNGVDLFYSYKPGIDPPMKLGDGGRTEKWWIPDRTHAIAGAAGRVELAGNSATGFRVWLDIGGGWHLGYFHLSMLLVQPGELLALGAPVGIVGDNPAGHDARHLHFELYFGALSRYPVGTRDPEAFLEGARYFSE
jgi:hypothetical protein